MESESNPAHFIRHIIDDDNRSGKFGSQVITRFPPEPNGYLHIGHAKSICLNFGIAVDFGGRCHLRFDDTNPDTESEEYQLAIEQDVRWLGFDWGDNGFHASDYFERLYGFACELIRADKAYVDSQTAEQIRLTRGTLTEPGTESPHRTRDTATNLDLFSRMRAGEFADGTHILRAKIDMHSPNINMRDPALYRIKRARHHRTGNSWPIYPMYDFTHCLSDALEGITHSLCTLEFEDHRPLYDWVIDNCDVPCHPQQIEFARLELNYTITSKRKLLALVEEGHVSGWDDPRMPTLKGMRRRGYPPAAIRDFCERVGITKKQTTIDMSVLENCVREDLDRNAPRAMAVLDPLKVVIENFDASKVEWLQVPNHPKNESMGTRKVGLTREIYIERDDFMEDPPKKFFRLGPEREVRLRYGYVIRCNEVVRDKAGKVIELRCSYDPDTGGGRTPDGRKVKGIIHWVSATLGEQLEVRCFDRLFNVPDPGGQEDFRPHLNPDSIAIMTDAVGEGGLSEREHSTFQFERLGYFVRDADSNAEREVFNRCATLRDTWAKVAAGR